MWLNFSEIELELLQVLCRGSASAGGLAEKLKKKNSFISRALRRLEQKGMVTKSGREISLSQTVHAQGFKRLYDSKPNAEIEGWLCSSAMDTLIALAGFEEGCEVGVLAEEVDCSKPTLLKVLRRFYSVGVVGKREGKIAISDLLVRRFAQNYADGICSLLLSNAKEYSFSTSICVGKNFIVRTDAKEMPPHFSKTGISFLAENGLDALLTSYNDFYFNLDWQKRSISTEEAFVHALLLTSMQQHQDKTVLAIFLQKNMRKLNIGKMRELAKKYSVIGELETMRQALDYAQKVR